MKNNDEFDWNSCICAGICVGAQINVWLKSALADWTQFLTAGQHVATGVGISAGKGSFSTMLQITGQCAFQVINYRPGTEGSEGCPIWTNLCQCQI